VIGDVGGAEVFLGGPAGHEGVVDGAVGADAGARAGAVGAGVVGAVEGEHFFGGWGGKVDWEIEIDSGFNDWGWAAERSRLSYVTGR
jgi:hypothetical protein